ncbi:MAG: helix-turn-helix domain-containing protein [Candidatus Izemoplasmataceae bacterium]
MPDVINNVKVGLLIKKLLKERNMTQEQLAGLLNISKSAVSQNLNGKSSFDMQNLVKISEIFNVSLDELLSQKSSGEHDVISEYERVTKKGLDELKKVSPKDLNIKEPDLYGKVLIEYIMEYGKVDMFKYLYESGIDLFHDYHHQAKAITLKLVHFMLEKNIDGVEKYIYRYTIDNGAFIIYDELERKAIVTLLNQSKKQPLVETLMKAIVTKQTKVLNLIPYNQKYKVLTNEQWIDLIASYQATEMLKTYFKVYDVFNDYPIMMEAFVKHHFKEGIMMTLDAMPKKTYTRYQLKIIQAQQVALDLSKLNDLELFKKVIKKGLFTDINYLLKTLIINDLPTLYDYVFSLSTLNIDYQYTMLSAITKGNLDLLKQYSHKLNQDQLNYLLSQASAYDLNILIYLLKEKAQFVTKYHNNETYTKVNQIINHLLTKEERDESNE